MSYCASRFQTVRRPSVAVNVGSVTVGGGNPIRLQSMTTSNTQDIAATVAQCIALAEVGCEIVRITAPNKQAAQALKTIRSQFTAAGFGAIPLVADIHFLPSAAMEAVEHVEKVRVNPGNYADKKKFAVLEYSDAAYDEELNRLHQAFSPLVRRCQELGRALRIGTNHGSLSDRIMNRYGDTPLGMVESALEFVRIAEDHGFHDIILSMKASNPKVMIEAYRLLVHHMDQAHRAYPLHLGVTEAGDGEDGRIKSAIGIGSLLLDGVGDTIRVSLTEDAVYEIPVAQHLARKVESFWSRQADTEALVATSDGLDPFHFVRRATERVEIQTGTTAGGHEVPLVWVRTSGPEEVLSAIAELQRPHLVDNPTEGLIVPLGGIDALEELTALCLPDTAPTLVWEADSGVGDDSLLEALAKMTRSTVVVRDVGTDTLRLDKWLKALAPTVHTLALVCTAGDVPALGSVLHQHPGNRVIITARAAEPRTAHPVGRYRLLAAALRDAQITAPLWLRVEASSRLPGEPSFLNRLLDGAMLSGSLLCDGLGDIISVETEPDLTRAARLGYNLLQGAGARVSKTEFVACPSCGRTLFDLQTTTQRIRAKTGHLKGVKIAIMGCIVNGPGEMADADFGYVGGAPAKINLYVGKTCVKYNIPQIEADEKLIELIREHGKWTDPRPDQVAPTVTMT